MSQKRLVSFGALFVLFVLLGLFWGRAPAPQAEVPEEQPQPAPPSASAERSEPPAVAAPAAAPAVEEPAFSVAAQREALGLAADAAGLGTVKCTFDEPPDGPVTLPFKRVVWDGRVAIGMVDEPEGIGVLKPAAPPVALLQSDPDAWRAALRASGVPSTLILWGDAFAGEEGWCRLEEPRRITVSGRIETEDGAPAVGAWVNGCSNQSNYVDDQGRFSFETWAGGPCVLTVKSGGIPGTGQTIQRSADVSGIVLVERAHDASEALRAEADEQAQQDLMVHPLEAALADPALDGEAREVLSAWLDEEREASARRQAFREQAADFFEENAEE